MRLMLTRQKLAQAAVIAASATLLIACDKENPDNPNASADTPKPGALLVSNGTTTVLVDGRAVTFPTTVTDAAWSPDGSRLVFVDADSNIATAHPDGTGVIVLTKRVDGVVRSHPTWFGAKILFSAKTGTGAPILRSVSANGGADIYQSGEATASTGVLDGATGEGQESIGSSPTASLDDEHGRFAFERQAAGGPQVWLVDLNSRQPEQKTITDGAAPALSPDGAKIAYVNPAGQLSIMTPAANTWTSVQITFGADHPSRPSWSPDGKKVVYATPSAIESVSADVPAGATANPATKVADATGVPSYLPQHPDHLIKIGGADPIVTAIAGSQTTWPTREKAFLAEGFAGATHVLLAATAELPTMLAGAQMVDDGPLLFTESAGLDPRTAAEIKRVLGAPTDFVPTVTVIGDTNTMSAKVQSDIRALGYKTERVSAADPYALAVAVAGNPRHAESVFVVDAADITSYASAISDLGARSSQTVLLTNGSTLPAPVKTFLSQVPHNSTVHTLGSAAKSALDAWTTKPAGLAVTPIDGQTSDAITARLLSTYGGRAETVVVVDKSSLSDVITAIGVARRHGAPVLVIDAKAGIDAQLAAWLDASSGSLASLTIVDSVNAVGADLQRQLGTLVSGPLGPTVGKG